MTVDHAALSREAAEEIRADNEKHGPLVPPLIPSGAVARMRGALRLGGYRPYTDGTALVALCPVCTASARALRIELGDERVTATCVSGCSERDVWAALARIDVPGASELVLASPPGSPHLTPRAPADTAMGSGPPANGSREVPVPPISKGTSKAGHELPEAENTVIEKDHDGLQVVPSTTRALSKRGARAVTVRASDVEIVPVRWLWPGHLPLGKFVLIDGDPDEGKTAIMLDVVPLFSPHDLRHRRISLWHMQGVPLAQVGQWVGQRNLSVTADVYTHVITDAEIARSAFLVMPR